MLIIIMKEPRQNFYFLQYVYDKIIIAQQNLLRRDNEVYKTINY